MPTGVRPEKAQYQTVTSSSAKFAAAMAKGQQYLFISTVDCWITVGATGGSASASQAGNFFVPAKTGLLLSNSDDDATNSFVHMIRDSADGKASLTITGP